MVKPKSSSEAVTPKTPRPIPRTGNPYTTPKWPTLSASDQIELIELLVELLSPIGQWRSQIPTSKGKRSKRKRNQEQPTTEEESHPDPPAIARHLTIGLNSTTRQLEHQQSLVQLEDNTSLVEQADDTLRAVFLTHPFASVQYAHLPLLAALCSPAVQLIPLHSGAEPALSKALGLPRVGLVGVRGNAPSCEPLWEMLRDVPLVQVPQLKEVSTGQWMGTKIEIDTQRNG